MRFLESLTYFLLDISTPRKEIKKFSKHKYVFILSTGRTGTKFFGNHYKSNKTIFSVHEPKPSYRLRMWSSAYLRGFAQKKQMSEVLFSQREKLINSVKESIYIESNPFIYGFSEFIDNVFSEPTYIHIIRDPRNYVRSSFNNGSTLKLKNLFNRYLPFWLHDSRTNLYFTFQPESVIQKFSEFWTVANNHIDISLGKKDNYYCFRFEDIFSDNKEIINRIEKIVGVKGHESKSSEKPEKINSSRYSVLGSWQTWTPKQCAILDSECGKLMKKYGYGEEPEWIEKVKQGQKEL